MYATLPYFLSKTVAWLLVNGWAPHSSPFREKGFKGLRLGFRV